MTDPRSQTPQLESYYAQRAREYERIYEKAERQEELAWLRGRIPGLYAGRRVLEIACGTGYWTQHIARTAAHVVACDINEPVLEIAREKPIAKGRAEFHRCDALTLAGVPAGCDAAFAGFWWSHVPRGRIGEFLDSLHARLEPGAVVALLDNRYVEGSSTPIAGFDADGNTFQVRRMADGTPVRVMKNFPSEEELRRDLAPRATAIEYTALEYYWLASYRLA